MSIKNKTQQNSWYCQSARGSQQHKLYNLFVEKKGIKIETVIECVDEFVKAKASRLRQKRDMLDYVTSNFDEFIKLLSEKTGVKFKKNWHKQKQREGYDEWWNRCNLDGSFAYNGVTDDF